MALCSVCGKNSDEVVRLFIGKRGNVCSECVEMCGRILRDKGELTKREPAEAVG